ncbi:MAG: Hsp20/alpha crystallin family protein [Deltaproteobacteria bacterium]|nr:Hsp20/alpha crystallin family protein [Deltaproteobacteria bacterium]
MAISPFAREENVRWEPGFGGGGIQNEMNRLWGPGFGRGGIQDEMIRLLADYFWGGTGIGGGYLSPAVDLVDTAENIQVKVDLPGIDRKNLEVILKDDALTIRGERKEDEKGENRYFMERKYGKFSRTLTLPSRIKGDKAAAKFVDGVLYITLPKTDEEKAWETKLEIT